MPAPAVRHRSLQFYGEPTSDKDVRAHEPTPPPIARKGFRPFFFLAALSAVAIVPIWILVLFGRISGPSSYLDATTWHAHEMIFGYVIAVIAGFLLTAVTNWTGGRETLIGNKLLGLAAIWAMGRVVIAAPMLLGRTVTALIDLSFLPLLIIALARPLIAARNRRNFIMLGVLGALFGANLFVHLDALGLATLGTGRIAMRFAVDIIILLCVIITGRVVPMFTRNATSQTTIAGSPNSEKLTIVAMIALLITDLADLASLVNASAYASVNASAYASVNASANAYAYAPQYLAASVAAIAGIMTIARSVHWGTRYTLRHPLLWILHAGCAWIAIGLLLRAAPLLHLNVPSSLATHALTLGAIGALTLGMMARVSLGHTGRPLVVRSAITGAFLAITLAALARVVLPLLAPTTYALSLIIAGVLWTAAFVIFLRVYTPILFRPRFDLQPG